MPAKELKSGVNCGIMDNMKPAAWSRVTSVGLACVAWYGLFRKHKKEKDESGRDENGDMDVGSDEEE